MENIRIKKTAKKYEYQIESLITMNGGNLVSFFYDAAAFGNMIVTFTDRTGQSHKVILDRDSITSESTCLAINIDSTSEHEKRRFLALTKAIEQMVKYGKIFEQE